MSRARQSTGGAAMLDLWRPPQYAGEPVGCLATTFTFGPGLFDEQCLGRFLGIESEPNREDLAFLLERESKLGGVYAGILVDHTQAGVAHSLRWDVLPVRIRSGRQHAKLSLLAWRDYVRIIIASANLTDPGYRTNQEVAGIIDLTPASCDAGSLAEASGFLRSLIRFVPGATQGIPEAQRAFRFLEAVAALTAGWRPSKRTGSVRQQIVCTLPAPGSDGVARSSLEEAVGACRRRGESPRKVRVASPFFDVHDEAGQVVVMLCKLMARSTRRQLEFCVPVANGDETDRAVRLAAPKTLLVVPQAYQADVAVDLLPTNDGDGNPRIWHAKVMGLEAGSYTALMVGSSNFTRRGMGVGQFRNAEANLLTIVDYKAYARDIGRLRSVLPAMQRVPDPNSAEWAGANPGDDEEEQSATASVPACFVSATYRPGDDRAIILRLDPRALVELTNWNVMALGQNQPQLLDASAWREQGAGGVIELPWEFPQPPEILLVQWADREARWPLNVEFPDRLVPPEPLAQMSAEDMLGILAATDPSAALRWWVKRRFRTRKDRDESDDELDSATPTDLDPLRRHDLQATFLHRVRRRALVLAHLRANLQRPVWGKPALEWRLRGLIGAEALAERLAQEVEASDGNFEEALLNLADLLIVLREVNYQPSDGTLPKAEFERYFRKFMKDLSSGLAERIRSRGVRLPKDLRKFWNRVVEQCQQ